MAEIKNLTCPKCGNKIGEREGNDIVPSLGVSVQITEGIIYFQCPCGEYLTVDENKPEINLFVPGFKRIH